jgi:hypothetical protein
MAATGTRTQRNVVLTETAGPLEKPHSRRRDLFEFMDQDWVPTSLRATLREIVEVSLASPFRSYYARAAEKVLERVGRENIRQVVELGAGTAPLCREIMRQRITGTAPRHLRLVPCDIQPDHTAYRTLASHYPGTIEPIYAPVDFLEPLPFSRDALVVLSAAFHHVPRSMRRVVLERLAAYRVIICEPVAPSASAIAFMLLSIVPAVLTPAVLLRRRSGLARRMFWCWLVPLAPVLIVWDGIVSCVRCWSPGEWEENARGVLPAGIETRQTSFDAFVSW